MRRVVWWANDSVDETGVKRAEEKDVRKVVEKALELVPLMAPSLEQEKDEKTADWKACKSACTMDSGMGHLAALRKRPNLVVLLCSLKLKRVSGMQM